MGKNKALGIRFEALMENIMGISHENEMVEISEKVDEENSW